MLYGIWRSHVPRTASKPNLSEKEETVLKAFANSRTHEARMVQRARKVLMAAGGESDVAIACKLGITVDTAGKWRGRFIVERLDGLKDRPRSGMPPKYDPEKTVKAILSKLVEPPPKGQQACGTERRWPPRRWTCLTTRYVVS
jgi:transposase